MIMPLCNDADRYTQVYWGIQDFERRFQRHPEGMWLPETAVDLPTLEVLADLDIRFTILAPRQAKRIRRLDAKRWKNVSEVFIKSLDLIEEAYAFSDWWFSGLTAMDKYFAFKKKAWPILMLRRVLRPLKRLLYKHDYLDV